MDQFLTNPYNFLIFISTLMLGTDQQKASFDEIDISDFSFQNLSLVTSEQKLY